MQIVEYLYATLFGNDLHAGSNFSGVLSRSLFPNAKCHLIVQPRKVSPPNIPVYLSSNGDSFRYTFLGFASDHSDPFSFRDARVRSTITLLPPPPIRYRARNFGRLAESSISRPHPAPRKQWLVSAIINYRRQADGQTERPVQQLHYPGAGRGRRARTVNSGSRSSDTGAACRSSRDFSIFRGAISAAISRGHTRPHALCNV